MSFNGTIINKNNGGLGGGETTDRVAAFVSGVDVVPEGLTLNESYELLQIEDLERLGFTENDTENGSLVHHHVAEIFRLSPETVVHFIPVAAATKASDLKTLAPFISTLRGIEGINTLSVAGVTKDATLLSAVAGLQILVDDLAKDHIYIDAVLLEGVGEYLSPVISDNDDLRAMASPNITVIVGQDPDIASAHVDNKYYAAVGSALGMLLVRSIHENLGSVDVEVKPRARKGERDYTLTDIKTGRFLSAALSDGTLFKKLSQADQKKLNDLGFVYIGKFSGYGGFFFSNAHTCTTQDNDYCFIERNAIWNKAARLIRYTLIPRIRSKVESDAATGYIKETTITDWDGRVRKALKAMVDEKNMADFDIYIDPKQAAVSTKPFKIKVKLVADGIVHEFEIDLGFTNKI